MIALRDGTMVLPDDVGDDEWVSCPHCGDDMHTVSGHTDKNGRFTPRYLKHRPDRSCGGGALGESNTHRIMKYVVSRKLSQMYEHGTIQREVELPCGRVADVAVKFEHGIHPLGIGHVVEVQYKNESKDKEIWEKDALQDGYSVSWVTEDDFSESVGSDYGSVEIPHPTLSWPNGVPEQQEWERPELDKFDVTQFGNDPLVEVRLPQDAIYEDREKMNARWSIGSGRINLDVMKKLEQDNADRRCDKCGSAANWYLLQWDVISTFRCASHFPQSAKGSENAEVSQ